MANRCGAVSAIVTAGFPAAGPDATTGEAPAARSGKDEAMHNVTRIITGWDPKCCFIGKPFLVRLQS
jgi:hypothetical protein